MAVSRARYLTQSRSALSLSSSLCVPKTKNDGDCVDHIFLVISAAGPAVESVKRRARRASAEKYPSSPPPPHLGGVGQQLRLDHHGVRRRHLEAQAAVGGGGELDVRGQSAKTKHEQKMNRRRPRPRSGARVAGRCRLEEERRRRPPGWEHPPCERRRHWNENRSGGGGASPFFFLLRLLRVVARLTAIKAARVHFYVWTSLHLLLPSYESPDALYTCTRRDESFSAIPKEGRLDDVNSLYKIVRGTRAPRSGYPSTLQAVLIMCCRAPQTEGGMKA